MKCNPADDASRGRNPGEMLYNKQWKHGPEFLWESDEENWPGMTTFNKKVEEQFEIRKLDAKKMDGEFADDLHCLFEKMITRYSDLFRLRRAVAWLLRLKVWRRTNRNKLNFSLVKIWIRRISASCPKYNIRASEMT